MEAFAREQFGHYTAVPFFFLFFLSRPFAHFPRRPFYGTEAYQIGTSKGDLQFWRSRASTARRAVVRTKITRFAVAAAGSRERARVNAQTRAARIESPGERITHSPNNSVIINRTNSGRRRPWFISTLCPRPFLNTSGYGITYSVGSRFLVIDLTLASRAVDVMPILKLFL